MTFALGACAQEAPPQPSSEAPTSDAAPYPPTLAGGGDDPHTTQVIELSAGDAATQAAIGDVRATIHTMTDVEEPPVWLTLNVARSGGSIIFEESNHAPYALMAQSAGGPLARLMGLQGDARPTLYARWENQPGDAPSLCPDAEWNSLVAVWGEREVRMAAIKGNGFPVDPESHPDPSTWPANESDVCARFTFTR
ncbi:MAG: hypothetical protein JNJ73_08265 [Hyphomonadaceae bacterium]|nr:hypothetical protein [Hyphomonadaceae bacterium]